MAEREEGLPEIFGPKAVDDLAFHQRMAIKHTGEGDMHLTMGLNEYIQAGEHLREVKALMEPEDFRAWAESPSGYNRSIRTVNRYIRVASSKELLESRVSPPASLNEALQLLALPKPTSADAEEQETRSARVDEASRIREERRKLKGARDAVARGIERIGQERRNLEDEREAIIEEIERPFVEEMAELKAKYGDVEEPRFAHVPPEEWERQIREAKSARVIEVAKRIREIYGWPEWMGHYWPEEAADAIEDMEGKEDLINGWNFIVGWMEKVRDELEERGLRDPYEKWK